MSLPTFDQAGFLSDLEKIAQSQSCSTTDQQIASQLDQRDELSSLRDCYILPSMKDAGVENGDANAPSLYLCGNSLGPLPKRTRELLHREIDVWGSRAVLGHFDHPHDEPWTKMEEIVVALMSDVVGAKPSEVSAQSTLTQNLHTMLQTFYRPHSPPAKPLAAVENGVQANGNHQSNGASSAGAKIRHKIIYETKAFPSDQYALRSAIQLAGFDPKTSLVPLIPREGELTLRTQDILDRMEELAEEGETLMIMLSGIQYYTGQWFEMEKITKKGKDLGFIVGWDLAHAFANVPLALHDWGVDFAVWCTYKYGSSGPGGIAGLFVHEDWAGGEEGKKLLRPAGWWGHNKSTRFAMPDEFDPIPGAAGFQMSNPSTLDMLALRGSLETLSKVRDLSSTPSALESYSASSAVGCGTIVPILRSKSFKLTCYLEHLLLSPGFLPAEVGVSLVTPSDIYQRGSQLSIRIPNVKSNNPPPEPVKMSIPHGDKVPPPTDSTTLLARVHSRAEKTHGLISDIRNPDMIRLAPLAQFSTFKDTWLAAMALREGLRVELGLKDGK